jgi:hypothetical protein
VRTIGDTNLKSKVLELKRDCLILHLDSISGGIFIVNGISILDVLSVLAKLNDSIKKKGTIAKPDDSLFFN